MRQRVQLGPKWTCPETDRVFATKKAYRKHLREQAARRLHNLPRTKARREFNNARLNARDTVGSFGDLCRFLEANVDLLVYRNLFPYNADGIRRAPRITVRFNDMRWRRNMVRTNDGWESGWRGDMLVSVENYDWFVRDLFKGTGLLLDAGHPFTPPPSEVKYTCVSFVVYVPDRLYPNIAFVARMKGHLDPNATGMHHDD